MTDPKQWRGLLLEDEPADETLIRTLMEDVHLDAVSSVADATRSLAKRSYSFVLCDMHVTDSRGVDTLRDVIHAAGNTPVIALTAKDPDVGDLTLQAGAQDFLPKDLLTTDSLFKAIRFALRRLERDEIRSKIAELIANDLRDPLLILRSEVEGLKFGGLSSQQNSALSAIESQCNRVDEIVRELQQLVKR